MASLTNAAPQDSQSSFSLAAFVAALFQLELREKLNAETCGDQSDGAYTWGM